MKQYKVLMERDERRNPAYRHYTDEQGRRRTRPLTQAEEIAHMREYGGIVTEYTTPFLGRFGLGASRTTHYMGKDDLLHRSDFGQRNPVDYAPCPDCETVLAVRKGMTTGECEGCGARLRVERGTTARAAHQR